MNIFYQTMMQLLIYVNHCSIGSSYTKFDLLTVFKFIKIINIFVRFEHLDLMSITRKYLHVSYAYRSNS